MPLLALVLCIGAAATADNRLSGHPSPYLAMHAADPVDWQTPDGEAVARAKRENRLLLVSIGYFACHWCHVMQRESFRDPDIARLMNENFVPVKADRELSAALDSTLQDFAARTRGYAGWPLNVFVTPDGYPLVAVSYAPPGEFRRILAEVAAHWRDEAPRLAELARQAGAPTRAGGRNTMPPRRLAAAFVEAALAEADSFHGGFGQVAKFPNAPRLLALLDLQARFPKPHVAAFLGLTLDAMRAGALWDHVGGGFFRYTVDPDWRTPHFEKMLYDNALLADVYLRAADVLRRPAYRRVAYDTLDFLLRDMRDTTTGAFFSSASAVDAAGREGGFYLFSEADLESGLSPVERALAARTLGIGGPREFAHGYLPVPTGDSAAARAILDKLRILRTGRELPRDRKLIAGWNGLVLTALSHAAESAPRFRPGARQLRDFLAALATPSGKIAKGRAGAAQLGPGELEDFSFVAAGLRAWGVLESDPATGRLAHRVARAALAGFHDQGGWRTGESAVLAVVPRQSHLPDGALPSPSAILIRVLAENPGDRPLAQRLAGSGIDPGAVLEHATVVAGASLR